MPFCSSLFLCAAVAMILLLQCLFIVAISIHLSIHLPWYVCVSTCFLYAFVHGSQPTCQQRQSRRVLCTHTSYSELFSCWFRCTIRHIVEKPSRRVRQRLFSEAWLDQSFFFHKLGFFWKTEFHRARAIVPIPNSRPNVSLHNPQHACCTIWAMSLRYAAKKGTEKLCCRYHGAYHTSTRILVRVYIIITIIEVSHRI